MKKFEVLANGQAIGFVEAVDNQAAVAAAYEAYPLNPKTCLSLRRDQSNMHILIDTTNWRALARHDSHKALAALAVIQFNNVDTVVLRAGENKSYSIFDSKQMGLIAASLGVDLVSAASYPSKIRALREAIETVDWLLLPFTTEDLEVQAYSIPPGNDRPMAFDPNTNKAKPLAAWHVEPQRNRARQDSPHWHMFASGLGYGAGVSTEATIAHMRGSCPEDVAERMAPTGARRSAPKRPPATPAAPKAPKPPRAPGAPATRPAAGTSTGKVWEAADAVRAKDPSLAGKELKAAVMAACAEQGINAGTCNVQFGKWKSSVGL